MVMSAEHRSKFAERLNMSGTINSEQTNIVSSLNNIMLK